jgi:MFS family permease
MSPLVGDDRSILLFLLSIAMACAMAGLVAPDRWRGIVLWLGAALFGAGVLAFGVWPNARGFIYAVYPQLRLVALVMFAYVVWTTAPILWGALKRAGAHPSKRQ